MCRVRLLGPVDVMVGGTVRPVPGLRRKAVLAVLALHPGEIVSAERLIDLVWDGAATATAPNTLQSHVSYLRRVFGTRSAVVARAPGYVLDVGAEATDVEEAERLISDARQAVDPALRVARFEQALAMWRGQPLIDVDSLIWLEKQAERLTRLRLVAVQGLIDARLARGEHAQLVPELRALTVQHQFDEHIHGQFMLALYRAGRQSEALEAYQRLRRQLAEDVGADPGPALRKLQTAILRHDAALDPPAPTVSIAPNRAAAAGWVPAQLPPAVRAFAGRAGQLSELDAVLAEAGHGAATGPGLFVITAVSGTAGVGKTALAVHWAHRVAAQFPDGQLYVNLRGFAPGAAMDPAEAVLGFLDALGVPVERIPAGSATQANLYRSVLASKRVLIVLDNARDAEQVRPLLPGSAGCLVVVTSRNQLTGLVAAEGAHPVILDLLPRAEARDLLARRLGRHRVAGEPEAVDEIITRCARLPLALAIAAALAATRPRSALATMASELREAAGTLTALTGDDPATDVRRVFSWSMSALSRDAARLFRLLGLHPGPDISGPAAASLAGLPIATARTHLAELAGAHLVTEHPADRHVLHDLLRAYAREQADAVEPDDRRRAAVRRLLDHYLHAAHAAARLLDPHRDPIAVPPPVTGVVHVHHPDPDRALAWFTAEHAVLMSAIALAADLRLDPHTWQLPWTLTTFFQRRGRWQDWAAAQNAALDAARRLADPAGQARAYRGIGAALSRLGRHDEAQTYYKAALDLFDQAGDPAGQARTHLNLAQVSERQERFTDAVRHSRLALDLFRAADHRSGQASALNDLAFAYTLLGTHEQALACGRESLALFRELGDRDGEAAAWDTLGNAEHNRGDHGSATTAYERALALYREIGDRFNEAETQNRLGDSLDGAGRPDAARHAWQQALEILDDLGHADADAVRAKLPSDRAAHRSG